MTQPPKKKHPLVKILVLLFIFTIPVIFVMTAFMPFLAKARVAQGTMAYSLSSQFTQQDLSTFIRMMKDDPEYHFYFVVLTEKNIHDVVPHIYQTLSGLKDKKKFREQVTVLHGKVESLAAVLSGLNYPSDFSVHPRQYPELINALRAFFYEDFKLTVAGVAYKTIYDAKFRFAWSDTARQAAVKFHKIVAELSPSQKAMIGDSFENSR